MVLVLCACGRLIGRAVDVAALVLIGAGIVFGIAALFGVHKHGKRGILVPAIIGIIMNALLLVGYWNQEMTMWSNHGAPANAGGPALFFASGSGFFMGFYPRSLSLGR